MFRVSALVLALIGLLLATGLSPHPAAGFHPPFNDNFADAIPITAPLPFSDSQEATHATLEVGEPAPCATITDTVWYAYTPSSDVVLTAHTAQSSPDTVLAVYTGASLATLATVACDDDGGPGSTSEVVFEASAGVAYYFQVSGPVTEQDLFLRFSLHEPPAKGNDDALTPVVIPESLPYSNKEDAGGATLFAGEPQPCAGIDNTVWYSYTPSSDGILAADTEGSTYDTALAIYTIGTIDPPALVGCDDNAGTFGQFTPPPPFSPTLFGLSRIAFQASAGETYLFQVGGAYEARGHLTFNLAVELPPVKGNDDFVDAIAISEPLPYLNKQDTKGALVEPNEPTPCHFPAGGIPVPFPIVGSVWYSYTPSSDVVLTAAASGNFGAAHAIYRGADMSSLTIIGCGLSSFIAGAGVTYYFQVGGCIELICDGSAGNLTFELSASPCLAGGCIEMALNIVGGDCDEARVPTVCKVPLGGTFPLSVDIVKAPPEGYILAQSFVDFGRDLGYKPTENAIDEILWPDCILKVRAQVDLTLPVAPRHSDETVLHACITEQLPPVPVSQYVGPFVTFILTCSQDVTSTEVKLLRKSHPTAGTNGALYTDHLNDQVTPLVNHLIINCVSPVGGKALGSELKGIAAGERETPTSHSSARNALVLMASAVAAVGGAAWLLRRRLSR